MYFKSRTEAGEKLAELLDKYRYENVAVMALNLGAVTVAEPIAKRLHALLGMFISEEICVPGEDVPFGTVGQDGHFMANHKLSLDETNEYYAEFHGVIEQQKREKYAKINRIIADGGTLEPSLLQEHVIILVSDGLGSGDVLAAAVEFLKPVETKRVVVCAPVASVQAIDTMHIMADELHCLGVTENFIETQHYYDAHDEPTREQAVEQINRIILNWK